MKKTEKIPVLFVVGGPGAGKGTQCAKIKTEFKYTHLSTGDILRNIVKEKKNPKWKELDDKMRAGQFVSSSELLGFVKDAFKDLKGKKVLLDGFPRNKDNITEWDKQMTDVADVKGVLYFDCPADVMKKRMLGRHEGRADDNEATMVKRIDNFNKETVPILPQYEKKGLLYRIDALKTVDEIFANVKKIFKDHKL